MCKCFLLDVDIQFIQSELAVNESDRQVKIEVGIVNGKTSSRDISVSVEPTANTATGELSVLKDDLCVPIYVDTCQIIAIMYNHTLLWIVSFR